MLQTLEVFCWWPLIIFYKPSLRFYNLWLVFYNLQKSPEGLVLHRWNISAPYNELVLPESLKFTIPEDKAAH